MGKPPSVANPRGIRDHVPQGQGVVEMPEGEAVEHGDGSARPVFISYASQDAAAAEVVVAALERSGVRCWIAPRDVVPGEFYADSIVHAIDAAQIAVLILSLHASASPHVLREVERAVSKRRPLVSVRLDLAALPAALEYFLNTSQWLDASATGVERALPKLLDAVQRTLGGAAAAPPHATAGTAMARAGAGGQTSAARPGGARRARPLLILSVVAVLALAGFAAQKLWRGMPQRAAAVAPAATPAARASTDKSIAVLPFVDLSEKHDQEYFADGMADELIDLLAKAPGLHVIARTSSFSFKGKSVDIPTIASRLKVSHVLEGSVRKAGDRLRVTTQLVRADSGEQLWSESYDRELKDVFRVQDEIAEAVVSALKLKLASEFSLEGSRGTRSVAAYNEFLLGRQFMNRRRLDDLRRAVAAYGEAIKLDPTYAAAYAELAIAQVYLSDVTGDAHGHEQAQAMANRAVELAPARAEGYSARGWLRTVLQWDWAGAEADLRKAIELDPTNSVPRARLANLLEDLGRLPEAIACARQALDLDPLAETTWGDLASIYTAAGDYAAARAAVERALQIEPEDPFALSHLGDIELLEGRAVEAMRAYEKADLEILRLTGKAMAEHTLGDEAASEVLAQRLIEKYASSAAYQIAMIFAWRNERERALEWLERAYQQRDGGLEDLRVGAMLRNVRGEARYKALLRKMNFPE